MLKRTSNLTVCHSAFWLAAGVIALSSSPVAADPAAEPSAPAKSPPSSAAASPQKAPPAKSLFAAKSPPSSKPAMSQMPDFDQINAAFVAYKDAILADDGARAARFVTKHIFTYYNRVRDWALYASKEKIQAIPFTDQVTILRLRMEMKPEQLMAQTGKGLFVYTVKNGWMEKEYLKQVELKPDVHIDDIAKGALVPQTINGRVIPGLVHFERENKRWKMNAYSLLLGSSFAFERTIRKMRDQRVQMVEQAIASIAGKDFDQDWWNAPKGIPSGKNLEEFGLDVIMPTQLPLIRHQQS